jgi:hypothetical protein
MKGKHMSRATLQIMSVRCICIAVLIASVLVGSQAQEKEKKYSKKDLPAAVAASFQKEYPKASIKAVSKEKEKGVSYWEIESVDGKTKRDLLYSDDGKKVETEETVEMSQLPAAVRTTLKGEYPNGKVSKAEKVMKGEMTKYEFHLKDGSKTHEVVIDPDGKLIKGGKEAKEGKDEDEDEDDDDQDGR